MAKAAQKVDVKVGATIRVDGHDYEIVAINDNGIFDFRRPEGAKEGSTSYKTGRGVTTEIRDSGEGWLYLPNRVTPKAPLLVRQAVLDKKIEPDQEAAVLAALRNHPKYHDRDDLAVQSINEMYEITLWEV